MREKRQEQIAKICCKAFYNLLWCLPYPIPLIPNIKNCFSCNKRNFGFHAFVRTGFGRWWIRIYSRILCQVLKGKFFHAPNFHKNYYLKWQIIWFRGLRFVVCLEILHSLGAGKKSPFKTLQSAIQKVKNHPNLCCWKWMDFSLFLSCVQEWFLFYSKIIGKYTFYCHLWFSNRKKLTVAPNLLFLSSYIQ